MCNWPYYMRCLLCMLFVVIASCGKPSEELASDQLVVTPAVVDFGSSTSQLQLQLQSKSNVTFSWRLVTNKPWLSVSPNQGTITAASTTKPAAISQFVTVSIDRSMSLSRSPATITLFSSIVGMQDKKQSEKIIPVKLVVVTATSNDLTKSKQKISTTAATIKQQDTDDFLPVNLTKRNFVENGAIITDSRTVTLKVAAEDRKGIAAYAVFDLYSTEKQSNVLNDRSLRDWVKVGSGKKFNAVLSYELKTNYESGDEIVIGVVFKNIDGGLSSIKQDSIIYQSGSVSGNVLSEIDSRQVIRKEPVALPYAGNDLAGEDGAGSSGDVFSIAGPGSIMPDNGGQLTVQAQSDNVQKSGGSQLLYAYNFEQGYGGWWVDNGQWQVGSVAGDISYRCSEGSQCAGTVLSANYVDYIESRLVSPEIYLTPPEDDKRIILTFVNWYAVHLHDLVRLQISEQTAPGQWSRWKTLMTHSGSSRQWKLETMGVTNYAGKTVRFAFDLYQPPDQAGTREGWYVDDFKVMIRR